MRESLLNFVVRVRRRRKESSRSLSHLVMSFLLQNLTKSLSGDELANVNFLYDDIVHVRTTKYNRLAHKFRHRSSLFIARHVVYHSVYCRENTIKSGSRNAGWRHMYLTVYLVRPWTCQDFVCCYCPCLH